MKDCIYEMIPLDKIELDTKNPRIAKWLETYGSHINEEQMAMALGAGDSQTGEEDTTYGSLKESIRTNGRIIHPIIVCKIKKGKYLAIEGNTRTLIYKELINEDKSGNWDKIPALIYNNLQVARIDAIRLQAHLVGPRPWDPYSKAKYIDFLRNNNHLTMDQIVDFCGGKKRDIINYIAAFNDMEKYYRPQLNSDADFDTQQFSAFVELQNTEICESLAKNRYSKKDFAKWVIQNKFVPLNLVRKLPRILKDNYSRKILLKTDAKEAFDALTIAEGRKGTSLEEVSTADLLRETYKRVLNMPLNSIQRLKELSANHPDKAIILDAAEAIDALSKEIISKEE